MFGLRLALIGPMRSLEGSMTNRARYDRLATSNGVEVVYGYVRHV